MSKPVEVEEMVDRYIHRPIAAQLIPLLVRWPITPNQVTLLSGIAGVLGSLALTRGAVYPNARLLCAGLVFIAVVLDCCDGQLARAKGISSTTGAIVDGLADYVVGISLGIGAAHLLVHYYHSPWYWLLGLSGLVSIALQSALFDHAKTHYVARVGGGYVEREEDIARIARDRGAARASGRWMDVFLLWLLQRYSLAQAAAMQIGPARDPEAYRTANRTRMQAWSFLGSGTHFALGYLCAGISYFWMPALVLFFALHLTLGNLYLLLLLATGPRQGAE